MLNPGVMGTAGMICDTQNDKLGCLSEPYLHCSYSEELEELTGKNYNFIGDNDYKTVGKCLFQTGSLMSFCDDLRISCKPPLLCLEEQEFNICLQPLNTDKCYFDDSCAPGFSCIGNVCVPEKNSPQSVQKLTEVNINNTGIFYFDPQSNNYTKLTIPGQGFGTITNIDFYSYELVLGKTYTGTNINKICLFDKSKDDLIILTYDSATNDYSSNVKEMQKLSNIRNQIIIDQDDNILMVSKENISTARKRSYQIAGTPLNNSIQLENMVS